MRSPKYRRPTRAQLVAKKNKNVHKANAVARDDVLNYKFISVVLMKCVTHWIMYYNGSGLSHHFATDKGYILFFHFPFRSKWPFNASESEHPWAVTNTMRTIWYQLVVAIHFNRNWNNELSCTFDVVYWSTHIAQSQHTRYTHTQKGDTLGCNLHDNFCCTKIDGQFAFA